MKREGGQSSSSRTPSSLFGRHGAPRRPLRGQAARLRQQGAPVLDRLSPRIEAADQHVAPFIDGRTDMDGDDLMPRFGHTAREPRRGPGVHGAMREPVDASSAWRPTGGPAENVARRDAHRGPTKALPPTSGLPTDRDTGAAGRSLHTVSVGVTAPAWMSPRSGCPTFDPPHPNFTKQNRTSTQKYNQIHSKKLLNLDVNASLNRTYPSNRD